ncbi:hypothetical protein [Arthrobacter glacialis]|uniref:hypothetical protein n=1 Tax=Arthrobacter glacialis TaxID=1664 RepID=UPI000CD47EB2|nr:hypothetical protein [Arthrobacter glacialis]POH59418.1 hypothetical protein CVS28_08080 [Arthrobacter glacialis]
MNVPANPRTDLPFLRRRIKPGRTQDAPGAAATAGLSVPARATAPSSPAASSPSLTLRPQATQAPQPPARSTGAQRPAGLVLGGAAPVLATDGRAQMLAAQREKAQNEDHEVQLLFPAPGIAELYELNLAQRVLRLSALESAVGTMVVSGCSAVAWESVRRVTGGATADGHKAGTPVMTAGNRELVGYHGKDALISLRHVRELRRAIFINRSSAAMGVRLLSGESIAVPPATNGTQIVLLVHRIGNVLELRAEPVPHDWPDIEVWAEFDFSMTHRAPASAYGR